MPLSPWYKRKKQTPEQALSSDILRYLLFERYEVIRFNSGGGTVGGDGDEGDESPGNYTNKKKKRFVWFYIWFGRVGQKRSEGVSDYYCLGDRDSFWLEVKTPEGEIKPQQMEFAAVCKRSNVDVYFPRSTNDVRKIVEERRERLRSSS